MSGPGSYNPQFRHGSPMPLPPPPPFQQGPPPPSPLQQGLPIPPSSTYQHGSYLPPSGIQPNPQSIHMQHIQHAQAQSFPIAPPRIMNPISPYLPPPPLVHGNTPTGFHSSIRYHTPHQTGHQTLPSFPSPPIPPLLAGPGPSEVMHVQPSSMGLSTPPSLGIVQGVQHIPSLPPPPPSSFVPIIPHPVSSFVHSTRDAQAPSMPPPSPPPPPPPPSSPPPLPPSPPSPSSCDLDSHTVPPNLDGSNLLESDGNSKIQPDLTENNTEARKDAVGFDGVSREGMNGLKIDAFVGEPSPPVKPLDEDLVHNIEVTCQFIAKVGPEFENLVRTKEADNPKFAFLIGGNPGSDAAISHEYFQWMKRKSLLEYSTGSKSNQNVLSGGISDTQVSQLQQKEATASPTTSDMDMEDDVDRPNKEQEINQTERDFDSNSVLAHDKSPVWTGKVDDPRETRDHISDRAFHNSSLSSSSSFVPAQQEGNDVPLKIATPADQFKDSSKVQTLTATSIQQLNQSLDELLEPVKVAKHDYDSPKGQTVLSENPFKLIQDYTSDESSDDDRMPCVEEVSPVIDSGSSPIGKLHSHEEADDSGVEKESSGRINAAASLLEGFPSSNEQSVPSGSSDLDTKNEDVDSPHHAGEILNDQQKITDQNEFMKGKYVDIDLPCEKLHHETKGNLDSTPLNVDEFGRLIRQGASDSDSDDARFTERRGKRTRTRTRSRSRSPQGNRRRRRPRRSMSRSWSPQRPRSRSRSRSRSPIRRIHDVSGDKARRERIQAPECLDFLRGRCYRGSSCRFIHRVSRGDNSRRTRAREHDHEFYDIKNSELCEDTSISAEIPSVKTREVTVVEGEGTPVLLEEMKGSRPTSIPRSPCNGDAVLGDSDISLKPQIETQVIDLRHSATSPIMEAMDQSPEPQSPTISVPLNVPGENEQETDQMPAQVLQDTIPEDQNVRCQEVITEDENHNKARLVLDEPGIIPLDKGDSAVEGTVVSLPSDDTVNPLGVSTDSQRLPGETSSSQQYLMKTVSNGLDVQPNHFPAGLKVRPDVIGSQTIPHKDHEQPIMPSNYHPAQDSINTQIFSSRSQVGNLHFANTEYVSLPPPPRQHSWGLPPPELNPRHNILPDYPLQRPHLSEESSHYRGIDVPLRRSPFSLEEFTPRHMPVSNSHSLASVAPSFGEALFPHPNILEPRHFFPPRQQSLYPSSSPPERYGPQPHFIGDDSHSRSVNMLGQGYGSTFAGPHNVDSKHQPGFASYPREKEATLGHQGALMPSHLGSSGTFDLPISRYTSGFLNSSQPSRLSSSWVPSAPVPHYNPYASTFELGPSTGLRPRLTDSSLSLGRSEGQFLPRSEFADHDRRGLASRDQYDPLYDSIESPSLNTLGKFDHGKDRNMIVRDMDTSLHPKPLDVEENNKLKEAKPLNHDELAETAIDAEVGVVENGSPQLDEGRNWSPDNPVDPEKTHTGEIDIEINQAEAPSKSKKSRDAKAMKLFRIALADFVKEVLKPSWRQGNMSKEAFKTIVKKTVDKVSGALPSHQIPKSQGKINQYIESSQRKLTKLVMGYVDKYVKV